MNRNSSLFILAFTAVLLISTSQLRADEKNAEAKTPADAPDVKQIETWISDLSAKQLSKRQKARQELVKIGAAAVPSLVLATNADDKNTREKSVSLLGVLLASKDKDTKDAAMAALQLLADSGTPAVAALAKQALNASGIPGTARNEPNFRATSSRVSVSVVNGAKTIDAEEHGRKVHIQEAPGKGIQMEITEGDKSKKLKIKDAAELKRKHPDAHKVYMKYASDGNAGKNAIANGFNFNFGPPAQNGEARSSFSFSSSFSSSSNGNQQNAVQNFNINNNNALPKEQAEMMIKSLEDLKQRLPANPQLHEIIDQQIRQLKEQQ